MKYIILITLLLVSTSVFADKPAQTGYSTGDVVLYSAATGAGGVVLGYGFGFAGFSPKQLFFALAFPLTIIYTGTGICANAGTPACACKAEAVKQVWFTASRVAMMAVPAITLAIYTAIRNNAFN